MSIAPLAAALAPVQQHYLLQARQMQALSFAVHIPLGLRDRVSGDGRVRRVAAPAHRFLGSLASTLPLIHGDAPGLYAGLVHGAALAAVTVSLLSGLVIIRLVWTRRFELARYGVAVPIGAVIGGWALARYPILLPGLSVHQATAPRDTLICLTVAVLAGGVLFPSLALLFRLTLGGHLQPPRWMRPGRPPGRRSRCGRAWACARRSRC